MRAGTIGNQFLRGNLHVSHDRTLTYPRPDRRGRDAARDGGGGLGAVSGRRATAADEHVANWQLADKYGARTDADGAAAAAKRLTAAAAGGASAADGVAAAVGLAAAECFAEPDAAATG